MYIWQLWHLEAAWHFQQWEQEKTNIKIIEAYFDFIARGIEKGAWVLNEVFAFLMQKREAFSVQELSLAERMLAFPDLPGIEDVQVPKHPGQHIGLYRLLVALPSGLLAAESRLKIVNGEQFNGILTSEQGTTDLRQRI